MKDVLVCKNGFGFRDREIGERRLEIFETVLEFGEGEYGDLGVELGFFRGGKDKRMFGVDS